MTRGEKRRTRSPKDVKRRKRFLKRGFNIKKRGDDWVE